MLSALRRVRIVILEYILALFAPRIVLGRAARRFKKGDYQGVFGGLKILIRVRPNCGEGRLLAGRACFKLNRYVAALQHLSAVESTDVGYAQALFLNGRIFSARNQVDKAIESFSEAVKKGINTELIWLCLADCQYRKKNFIGLRSCSEKILSLNPNSIEGCFFNGEAYRYLGDIKLAQKAFIRTLDLDPHMFYAVESMAWMLREAFGAEKALAFLNIIIESKEASAKAPFIALRGELFVRDCRYQEAESSYQLALEFNEGKESARIWTNLGILLWYVSRVDEALDCFECAIKIDPQYDVAKLHRSLVHLLKYEFSLAWKDYEFRKICGDSSVRVSSLTDWIGPQSRDSKVLIYAEQGLGDEIMFASCIPELQKDVVECVIECDEKLVDLFALSFPWAAVTTSNRGPNTLENIAKKFPDLNCALPIGSLPKFYRANDYWEPLDSYLEPATEKISYWKQKLDQVGPGLKIGVSWQGGTEATRSSLRSIPLIDWGRVLNIPECTFVSLQYGDTTAEIAQVTESIGVNLLNWKEVLDDYHETAALTKALDLVVSVQTAIVHLSGAMGVKTIALIPYGPEWRYGIAGDTMRWYQSVTLLRQKEASGWDNVLSEVYNKIINMKSNRTL